MDDNCMVTGCLNTATVIITMGEFRIACCESHHMHVFDTAITLERAYLSDLKKYYKLAINPPDEGG